MKATKQQTAVQKLFIELEEKHPQLFNIKTVEGRKFINDFHKYLVMEKEQIINSVTYGQNNHTASIPADRERAEQYYTETYGE